MSALAEYELKFTEEMERMRVNHAMKTEQRESLLAQQQQTIELLNQAVNVKKETLFQTHIPRAQYEQELKLRVAHVEQTLQAESQKVIQHHTYIHTYIPIYTHSYQEDYQGLLGLSRLFIFLILSHLLSLFSFT